MTNMQRSQPQNENNMAIKGMLSATTQALAISQNSTLRLKIDISPAVHTMYI